VVAEVAHRTSILPLVMAGVADAVLPAGWTRIASLAGADVLAITPPSYLRVALVYRKMPLTPTAEAFLAAAKQYVAQHL
jgi:DNA-binding transcriptional LysR family regulator